MAFYRSDWVGGKRHSSNAAFLHHVLALFPDLFLAVRMRRDRSSVSLGPDVGRHHTIRFTQRRYRAKEHNRGEAASELPHDDGDPDAAFMGTTTAGHASAIPPLGWLASRLSVRLPLVMNSPAPSDQKRYALAWKSLRLRRRVVVGFFLLYLPVVGIYALCFAPDVERDGSYAAFVWLALIAAGSIWLCLFRCPRCDELFGLSWFSNPFARRCLHCGIRTGSGTGAASTQSDGRSAWDVLRR
jgi:hypothetical protein